MKKILCLLLTAAMLASAVGAIGAENVTLTLNGNELDLEYEPIVRSNAVFIPIRSFCEACGFEVEWDDETKTVAIDNGASVTRFAIGEKEVKKDGMPVSVSEAAFIENGRTYVPTDILNVMGAAASWDDETAALAITVDFIGGRYFKIVQTSTGKAFASENANLYDGGKIIVEDAAESDFQVWKFVSMGNSTYMPVNKKSGRTFDISAFSVEPGASLGQYGINYGDNQCVIVNETEDGSCLLQCKHSELYLTVSQEGRITQEELVGDETQLFSLIEVEIEQTAQEKTDEVLGKADSLGGKFYSIAAFDDTVVSVSSLDETASIITESAQAKDETVWKLILRGEGEYQITNKASGLSLAFVNGDAVQKRAEYGDDTAFEFTPNDDGTFVIKDKNSSLCLTASEGKIMLSAASGDASQCFSLIEPLCSADSYDEDPIGGKYYTITEASTGQAVGVEDGSLNDSAKIITENVTGGDSQVWAFITAGGGMYTITNKASSRSFDIPASSTQENASLTQYATNYGDNQIFELIEASDGSYMFKNKNSGLYLTVVDGYLKQMKLGRSNYQSFTLSKVGESSEKIIGAAATLFLLKGEDKVTNAKLQWNSVNGAEMYDVYRSVDGGEYKLLTSLAGNSIDDYDLEIGSSYSYAVYALDGENLIDYAVTQSVEPYDLPADLNTSSNLEESSLNKPNSLCVDGVYYRYSAWGRDDGGSGFGSLMMTTSTDDITYSEPVEVLSYKDILAHETCEGYDSCRFESQNVVYNPILNKVAFIAHFEADGGYGTAKTSIAVGTPGEYFTFYGAVNPEGDDTRDLNVYVDDDYSAYLIAAVHNNADLALYKLTDDWTGIEKRLCYVNQGRWRELPSMLKVDGMYYLFTSGTAGWYPTQGMYNTATSIEGPWSPLKTVGNTSTFSSQSGSVSRLKSGSTNYIMSTYRWMYYWQDAILRRTTNRRYPVSVSNGYAFYDFYDELLYNWDNDDLVGVQNGRILSQGMPAAAETDGEEESDANLVNDGNYQSYWYGGDKWPYSWEVDLGEVHSLSEIQISWLIWNGSEAYYQYKVEVSSDGENYTEILDKTEGYTDYGFTVDELTGSGRYVRLTVVNARSRSTDENIYPAQLYEVKVLGK